MRRHEAARRGLARPGVRREAGACGSPGVTYSICVVMEARYGSGTVAGRLVSGGWRIASFFRGGLASCHRLLSVATMLLPCRSSVYNCLQAAAGSILNHCNMPQKSEPHQPS
jgi:hypothetical protein